MPQRIWFDWEKIPADYPHLYDASDRKYRIYSESAKALVKLAHIKENECVLDVACGTGISTEQIFQRVKRKGKTVGIDVSENMLQLARERFSHRGNVQFLQFDALQLSQMEETFDVVLSNFGYWSLMSQAPLFFREASRVLSAKGRLIFNVTPFLREFALNGKTYNAFGRLYAGELERAMRRRGLPSAEDASPNIQQSRIESLLKRAGFQSVTFKPFQLPLTAQQAFDFMYETFWRFGAKSYSGPLASLPPEERAKIFQEVVKRAKEELEKSKNTESPHIFNVLAKKEG